jgi:hypothetical protein
VGPLLRCLRSGDSEGYGEEGSGDGHHPMGFHYTGTMRDSCNVSVETVHLSMRALFGETVGGYFAGGPEG